MSRETWTRGELFEGLDAQPAFVAELERLGLLRVVGRDTAGEPLYAAEAREELEKVISLVELGYRPKDIAAIARKVGLPAKKRRRFFRKPPVHLRAEDLSSRSGVPLEQVEAWIADGRLEPDLVSESGEALYAVRSVRRVRLLDDLVALGVEPDDVRGWGVALAALEKGGDPDPAMLAAAGLLLERTTGRLERVRRALRDWDKLAAGYRKRLQRLGRAASGRPRTGRRKRVRTRTRGRKGP